MVTVKLRKSRPEELQYFSDLEADADTRDHITPYSLQQHQSEFASSNSVYLSICADRELVGFLILALESDNQSVEFKRIVIARKGVGIGLAAIRALEAWCIEVLQRRRIWLDVFASNLRARQVYAKLGYQQFDSTVLDDRPLLYLQKNIGNYSAHL
jgi:RimJ/RimL family protein N-acetyltransferase